MPHFLHNPFNFDSLRNRILLLVVLALLPPLALTTVSAMRERRHAISVAESDLQRLTGLAAASEARSIEGVRQFLVALSDVPDVMREAPACRAMLQTMLKKNAGYINLGVLDVDGSLRCSAQPAPLPREPGARSVLPARLEAGKFAISDYAVAEGTRKHAVNATYPITDDDNRVIAVLVAVLDLAALDQFATDIEFPPNAVMVTTDGHGTVIGRRPNPDAWIGRHAEQKLLDLMLKVRFGTAEITGADGIARLHAFAQVGNTDVSNYTVSIGMPTADIVASANRNQATELLALLLTALLALVTTWFVARFTILNRLHTLLMATRQIAAGELGTRTNMDYGREEISELARAFDRMAASLQRSAAERDDALAHLFAEKERAQVTLASIGDGVIATDAAGCVTYLNPLAETLTGWRSADAAGHTLAEVFRVIDGSTREPIQNLIDRAIDPLVTDALGHDSLLIGRDGNEYAIEDSAAPIRDRAGQLLGAVVVFHDVSDSRILARQLSHQASHDPLTGLVNRREFERRLQQILEHSTTQQRQHALLFLDLDRFKVVNDTCGHHAGDELLRQITAMLQPLLRDSDTLARVGGDEFAALLENCTPKSAARIADKLCKTVSTFRFTWQEQVFPIGVSIGLVNFSNADMPRDELISAADSACYQAKEAGRNRVYEYQRIGVASVAPDTAWRRRLEDAIAGEHFVLLSQEVRTLGVLGRPLPYQSMLLRMTDEHGAHVPPGAFLPAAERFGLMPALDRWLLHHALTAHVASLGSGHSICAVSLSGSALADPGFIDFAQALLQQFSLPAGTLCFEIAETTAIAHLASTMRFIDVFKPLGCLFALDDFGGGMSSFAYLAHLRVDFLKIDGSFIVGMLKDPIDLAKVEAINHISHAMGIRTIAKHVEDQDTIDRLRTIRVDLAQGSAIGLPVPVAPLALLADPAATATTHPRSSC